MKLSNETLNILRNFAAIQPNLLFKEGTELKTIAEAKNIVAKASITENIPSTFGIYDLDDFLKSLSLFSDPNFVFSDDNNSLQLTEGKNKLTYYFSDAQSLTHPTRDVAMPPTDFSFTLTAETLNSLRKATSLLNVSTVSIETTGSEDGVVLVVKNPKNSTSNAFSVELEEKGNGHNFKFHFDIGNFKILPGDYEVAISGKLISHFKHKTLPIEYWIALEKTSTYED